MRKCVHLYPHSDNMNCTTLLEYAFIATHNIFICYDTMWYLKKSEKIQNYMYKIHFQSEEIDAKLVTFGITNLGRE